MRFVRQPLLIALFFGLGALACNDSSGPSDEGGKQPEPSTSSKPQLRGGQNLEEGPACGVDQAPCEGGLTCATVDLAEGSTSARCVDPVAVCNKLQCATGDCGVRESFPATITCLTSGGGGGDDDPDGSVSSPPAEYCEESACGAKPTLSPKECPPGQSYAGLVGPCAKTATGCSWVVFECVTPL
jgi:hypothetical protein